MAEHSASGVFCHGNRPTSGDLTEPISMTMPVRCSLSKRANLRSYVPVRYQHARLSIRHGSLRTSAVWE
jgi:hypothetical protein